MFSLKSRLTPALNGAMVTLATAPFNAEFLISMSKKRADEPYVQQKVNIPATLMARFSLLYWDPVLKKVRYGKVSEIVTKLLTDHVNKTEAEQRGDNV